MDLDLDATAERGLRHYVNLVTDALGLPRHGTYVSLETPANAYVALDGRLATHPARDVALLWDEQHGWSVAVETHGGADLLVLTYLGGDVLPEPAAVAAFVRDVFTGTHSPAVLPGPPDNRDLPTDLARFIGQPMLGIAIDHVAGVPS